jgi:hypothetical protein
VRQALSVVVAATPHPSWNPFDETGRSGSTHREKCVVAQRPWTILHPPIAERDVMTNHTYRVIEIVGTSPDGIDAAIRLVRGAVRPRTSGGRGRRTLPGDAKGRLPARGRLVDRLARQRLPARGRANRSRPPSRTRVSGLGGIPREHRACRDEPGVIHHHERRQQPVVHESKCQPARRISPSERATQPGMAESRHRVENRAALVRRVSTIRRKGQITGIQGQRRPGSLALSGEDLFEATSATE